MLYVLWPVCFLLGTNEVNRETVTKIIKRNKYP